MKIFIYILFINEIFSQGGGYALDFDGSNDFVRLTNLGSFTNTSVTFWAKHNGSNSDYDRALGMNWGKFELAKSGNGQLRIYTVSLGWNNLSYVMTQGQWTHVAITLDGTNLKIYIDGAEVNSYSHGNISFSNSDTWGLAARPLGPGEHANMSMDEVSIWSDSRTAAEIKEYMHKELAGNESNLVSYYKMSNGSGTSLTDNSSNSNTGTLINMNNSDWVTSQAPIGNLGSSYKTDVEGIWKGTGTSESDASNGLTMTVSSALSTGNFAVFGNNNTSSISTADLGSVGSTSRTARLWQLDESGTVAATIKIDISDATGESGHSGTASNYRLLYRSGTTGDFSSVATGSSISGDVVTFNNISIQDGYYAMGAEADASLPVELTSFELLSNRESSITLQWVTESEINNLGFILDRRTPNTDWAQIASYITDQELRGQGSVSHQTIYTYTDENVHENQTYDYRLADVDYDGNVEYHTTQLMGLTMSSTIPEKYRLYQNYPNPFNPITNIRYDIPEDGQVSITIYDVTGNRVNSLINRPESAGTKLIQWNARDEQGRAVSAGIYICTITANQYRQTNKMVLLK